MVLQTIEKSNIGLVRADSGYFSEDSLACLEAEDLKYILAVKMYASLVQKIFDSRNWVSHGNGIDICSFDFRLQGWDQSRRFVVVRKLKSKHPGSGGKSLFEEYDKFSRYLYSAFVTNLDLSDFLVWETYRHRAEAETQIRKLKENYGINEFCCEDFGATDAAFRWVCTTYNLMSLYKIALINSKHDPTLATLKIKCIAIATYLVRHGRKTTLVMSASENRRVFFDNLFQKIENISPNMTFRPNRKFLMN